MTLLAAKAPLRLAAPPPAKAVWHRRLFAPLAAQFTQGITAEKIALSLAVGSFCAFFPVLGAATPLCVVAGAGLRLNQPVIQVVNWLTAPLYLPLVFVFVRLGEVLLGARRLELAAAPMAALLRHDPANFFLKFSAIAGHALVGWAVLAPGWIAAGYFLSLPVLRVAAGKIRGATAGGTRGSGGRR